MSAGFALVPLILFLGLVVAFPRRWMHHRGVRTALIAGLGLIVSRYLW